MASLKDVKNKIGGVKKTKQITKAMNMVASAKLRGAQTRIERFRPYAEKFYGMLTDLAGKTDETAHPLLAAREEGYQLIEKMRSAAVEERQRKIAEAKALAAAEAEKAKKRLQEETSFAKAEAENDAEELAEKIAATILRT